MTARRVALGSLVILVAVYGASPWLAANILPPLLARWGVESSHFAFGYPRWNGIDLSAFDMTAADTHVTGRNIRVSYRIPRLFGGEVDSVVIDELTVHLGRAAASTDASGSYDLPAFWTLVPARQATIGDLFVTNADPPVSARGNVSFDPDVLRARLGVESPLLVVPLDVSGAVNPDGRIAVTLMERGSTTPLGSLTGVPDDDHRAMTLDGRIALTGRPLALAGAYGGFAVSSGSVELTVHGRTNWPLPAQGAWEGFAGDGSYRIELEGSAPGVSKADARISGDFVIANGEVKARLESGGLARIDVPELRRVAGTADVEERVSLENDQAVAIDYAQRSVRVGDGLIITLTAADKPIRVRPRGAFGADGHFELGVMGLDGAPIVLATGAPTGVEGLTVKGQVALTGKVLQAITGVAGVSATGGHLVTDFEGTVRRPLSAEMGLRNVEGQGRVRLALTGRLTPERLFDVAVEGDYTIGDSIKAVFDPGAHVVLAADGVELSTVSALTVELQPTSPVKVIVDSVDLKVALPPISAGKHTIALSNAWISLEQVKVDGDAVAAAATLRTHAGRDALSTRVTLSHDLASAKGAFTVGGDWIIKKAALTTQLPGFNAVYDLDEGTIALALDGRWNASKKTYSAKGHIRVNGRRAHYEDYAVEGLAVDVPLKVDTDSFAVAATKVSIDSIDVGFPLTNLSLDLAVANGAALIRDLTGSVLGGRFSAEEFSYELATDKSQLAIDLNGISLADVLALEGGDVNGSGTLDGKLPVVIDGEAFSVVDGRIAARPPGGTLMYKGAAASSMVAQSGFGFAFQALEDFRYDTLDANVALATDGTLALGVKLKGVNPAVENGRAIQFNLNVTESVPALLESLRAAEGVTERVEQRFSR